MAVRRRRRVSSQEFRATRRAATGRKSVGKIFSNALHRIIEVREGERIRAMPKIEAVIEVNLNKALKGDHRSFAKLMDVADKLGIVEPPPDEQKFSMSKDEIDAAREKLGRLIEARVKEGIEAGLAKNAAPGCNTKTEKVGLSDDAIRNLRRISARKSRGSSVRYSRRRYNVGRYSSHGRHTDYAPAWTSYSGDARSRCRRPCARCP